MAEVLGRDEEARRYENLFQEIRRAFNDAYVEPNGRIRGDTQAGYALALNMNLLEDSMRPTAMGHLLEAIERYNGHLSTGFHTAYRLMLELSRSGHHEEACRLINLTSPPSWGYMIEQGATTMWERWDGYVEGRGFHDPGMNSFNHYMFGSVGEWVWRNIVGLNPDEEEPAYKHFVIHPHPGSGFSWARGEYESVRGTIVSDWRIDNDTLHLTVAIPANTTATILLETSDEEGITESGRPADEAEGVSFVTMKNGTAVFHVESGTYAFSAPLGRDR